MIAKKHLPNYTYKDYEQWEGQWELIHGIPYAMSPSPGFRHQKINLKIGRYFDEALDKCKKCTVVMPIDYKIDENVVVQPDLLIVCHEWEGHYLETPPELVVEILSGSTAHKDRVLKYELYESQQVKYYLIVNPVEEVIDVYLFDGKYQLAKQIEKADAIYEFELSDCMVVVDFSKIW